MRLTISLDADKIIMKMLNISQVKCTNCGRESQFISRALKVCLDCIRKDFKKLIPHLEKVHAKTREGFHLPLKPPRDPQGVKCNLCVNECQIPEGEKGFCGLRENGGGTGRKKF